jgi:hypothetical protein
MVGKDIGEGELDGELDDPDFSRKCSRSHKSPIFEEFPIIPE